MTTQRIDLVCPAGSLPALKAAVDNGANAVYLGLRDGTNARNFPGLNFDEATLKKGIRYAHDAGVEVLMAINTYPRPRQWQTWTRAVDIAAGQDIDALIMADTGLMHYACETHPHLRLHLSVQGSATNHQAIEYYARHFNIKRAVLPRVLSLSQVRRVIQHTNIEIEVFGFGSLCVMVEGRCTLSSYVTGKSPNSNGVCSPAEAVRWEETTNGRRSRLNGVLIDEYSKDEAAGYPTLCKGRYLCGSAPYHAMEEPTNLNVLEVLPDLVDAGVSAIKVEGRQRSPAYVAQVTAILRQALDHCLANPGSYRAKDSWLHQLDRMAEGSRHTLGALHRPWQ
ncbi:MAG: U32 family peptidase [Gammaproteobacteria bacterium]|nr:U32 family peptidase [Gammaproteobacteria bacterium]